MLELRMELVASIVHDVPNEDWEDITDKVSTEVQLVTNGILVYLSYNKETIGLFDLSGFHSMRTSYSSYSYQLFPNSSVSDGVAWFRVFRKPTKSE